MSPDSCNSLRIRGERRNFCDVVDCIAKVLDEHPVKPWLNLSKVSLLKMSGVFYPPRQPNKSMSTKLKEDLESDHKRSNSCIWSKHQFWSDLGIKFLRCKESERDRRFFQCCAILVRFFSAFRNIIIT